MISVVIPTLNEAKNIPTIIKESKKLRYAYELIFVDDNSDDGTAKIIKKLKTKKVKFIKRIKKKKDLSKSIMLGVNNSKYNNILVMDCDLQHNIDCANMMIEKFFKKKKDIIVGSRFLKKKYSGNLSFVRTTFSLFFILLINLFFKKETTDPLSGFFVCKKNLFLSYKKYFYLNGYKILFDVIYNSRENLTILDHQINFKKRKHGESKLDLKIVIIFIKQCIFTFKNKNNR